MRLISVTEALQIWHPAFPLPRIGEEIDIVSPDLWGHEVAARRSEWRRLFPEQPPEPLCHGPLESSVRAFGWWCGQHIGDIMGREAAWTTFRDEVLDSMMGYRVVANGHECSDIGIVHPLVQGA